jgi:glycosyltransferase involved in cell wall biosynthesis
MLRVLHVSAYYAPAFVYGGPPRSIHGLCRALRGAGVDVHVLTTDANGEGALPREVTAPERYEGVPVRYFPRTWPAFPIGSRPLTLALRQDVKRADLVHIHGLWNRVVWTAAREARRAGVPYVLSPRGMLESAALMHRSIRKRVAWQLVERATIEGAALLHATSERELATLRALRPEPNVVLVPNGVDIPLESGEGPRDPVIAFVGRLHPIKRLDLLVDAFASLHAARPDVRLVVAGPDEAGLRDPLTVRAGAAGAAITWLGPVDSREKAALLARAAALVMCSDSESFGLSAAEAMAAGVPVVVTRTCPWAEVERCGAGFWVDQRPGAIAEALQRLLANPEAARAMGARGRALIESRYRWEAVAQALRECYEEVASAVGCSEVVRPAVI